MTNYEKHLKSKLKGKTFRQEFEKESHKIKVAYEIFKLRKGGNMSQEVLAKKIGTTQSVIARMEAGKQNFSLNTLQKIAKIFDKNIEVVFTNK